MDAACTCALINILASVKLFLKYLCVEVVIILSLVAKMLDQPCFLLRAAVFIHLRSPSAAHFKLCKLSFA